MICWPKKTSVEPPISEAAMTRIIPFSMTLLALACAGMSGAQADTFTRTSQIQAVTVHPGLASVTRRVALTLPSGEHTLLLPDFPAGLDENSLHLSGQGAALQIGGVEIRHIQASELVQPEAQQWLERQQVLQDQFAALQAEGAALSTQESFLQALAQAPGKADDKAPPLPASEWPTGVKALGDGMRAVGLARVKLAQQQRGVQAELAKVGRELQRLQSQDRESRTLAINLHSSGGEAALTVEYQVAGAGWQPVYEARLDTRSGQLELTRAALVQQVTGENWDQVALRLATSRPQQTTQAPDAESWWLDLHDESRDLQKAAQAGAMMSRNKLQEEAVMLADAPAPAVEAKLAMASLDAGEFVAEYQIPGAVSIASNQDRQRVILGQTQQQVSQRLQALPRLDPHAYLYADVKNPLQAPWLAGEWRVSRDGAYIGARYQPQVEAGGQLALAFGVDDAVKVTAHVLQDEQGETGVLNKEQTLTRRWRYQFVSGHQQAMPLSVLDVWPVTRNALIKVTPLDNSPAPSRQLVDDKPGVQAWDLTLPGAGKLQLEPGYRISYPYQRKLEGF
jgi:uncharacterized protein (TIGR02231 family)